MRSKHSSQSAILKAGSFIFLRTSASSSIDRDRAMAARMGGGGAEPRMRICELTRREPPSKTGGSRMQRSLDLDRPVLGRLCLEHVLHLSLLLLAAALRLAWLGNRPLHHDESIHAYYS